MAHAKRYLFEESEKLFSDYSQALGHPARQRIVSLLKQTKHCCFEDILESIPLSKSAVQSHIKALKRVDLIIVAPNEFNESGYQLNQKSYSEAKALQLSFW